MQNQNQGLQSLYFKLALLLLLLLIFHKEDSFCKNDYMQLHLNCISAGFQTSEKTTVLGGRGRRGKPSILPFLLFPIHYERKFIYN